MAAAKRAGVCKGACAQGGGDESTHGTERCGGEGLWHVGSAPRSEWSRQALRGQEALSSSRKELH